MKRSQLVSISMSESNAEEGENVIAVVYRARPSGEASDVPFDNLEHKSFDIGDDWESNFASFRREYCNKDVVSVTHTPKYVGNGHNQTAFYVDRKGDG